MKRRHGWLIAALAWGSVPGAHAGDRAPSLVIATPAPDPLSSGARAARVGDAPPGIAPSAAARAAVVLDIQERIVRYTVPGDDLEALRAALADQALAEDAGGSHGRTRSDIQVRFEPLPVVGGCVADAAAIDVLITTTLPEWEPGRSASGELRDRWQAMAAALQRHEARHRDHVLEAVRQLQSRLSTLGVQADCHALRAAVDRAFLAVTVRAEFLDGRYDRRTRNGVEEGIVL